MFLSILITCLIGLSSCSNSVRILDNQLTKQEKIVTTDLGLIGSYNFRNDFDYSSFTSEGSETITFENTGYYNLVTFASSGSNTANSAWSCMAIDLTWLDGGPYVDMDFHIYNGGGISTVSIQIALGQTLAQINSDYKDLILNFNTPIYLHGDSANIFNIFFTNEDNAYTTTYTGYYNFNNDLSSINNPVTVFGAISFDNKLFKSFTNTSNGALGSPTDLIFLGYDVNTNGYIYYDYNLPFDVSRVVSQNVLLTGSKMTLSTYNSLSNVGVFTYIKDSTYDDSDFQDLLFTIADVPVYFISQFLSFELLGMNLYIALSGLITLLVVIFVIRKIF